MDLPSPISHNLSRQARFCEFLTKNLILLRGQLNNKQSRLQFKIKTAGEAAAAEHSTALGDAVDAEHFRKISCLVDFIGSKDFR